MVTQLGHNPILSQYLQPTCTNINIYPRRGCSKDQLMDSSLTFTTWVQHLVLQHIAASKTNKSIKGDSFLSLNPGGLRNQIRQIFFDYKMYHTRESVRYLKNIICIEVHQHWLGIVIDDNICYLYKLFETWLSLSMQVIVNDYVMIPYQVSYDSIYDNTWYLYSHFLCEFQKWPATFSRLFGRLLCFWQAALGGPATVKGSPAYLSPEGCLGTV